MDQAGHKIGGTLVATNGDTALILHLASHRVIVIKTTPDVYLKLVL
jgi:hypothetical protein